MSVDTVSDFLTVIRNAVAASKAYVRSPYSKVKLGMLEVLKEEGFIQDFAIEEVGGFKFIKVFLKYFKGASVIHEIKRVSKPGCRVYLSVRNVKPVVGGLGISILTTNKGIMSDKRAKKLSLGGELLCTVW